MWTEATRNVQLSNVRLALHNRIGLFSPWRVASMGALFRGAAGSLVPASISQRRASPPGKTTQENDELEPLWAPVGHRFTSGIRLLNPDV